MMNMFRIQTPRPGGAAAQAYRHATPTLAPDWAGHEAPPAMPPRARPPARHSYRLALVVGSGGVRSIAVLGFAQGLREAGLEPDLLAACSAGAMFSALLAQGLSVEEGMNLAATLWTAEVTRQRRRGALAKMLWPRWCGFNGDFSLRRDDLVLARLHRAFGELRIEQLPVPLRVVATCLETGANVCIERGSLAQALRASIGIPFLFAPQTIDGQRLVDGFLCDPLPVARAADAELTVALGFLAPQPVRIDKPQRLLGSITSTMTNNLMHAQLSAARGQGQQVISVFPEFDRRVGLFDIDAMQHVVDKGREAAYQALPQIEKALAGQPAVASQD